MGKLALPSHLVSLSFIEQVIRLFTLAKFTHQCFTSFSRCFLIKVFNQPEHFKATIVIFKHLDSGSKFNQHSEQLKQMSELQLGSKLARAIKLTLS